MLFTKGSDRYYERLMQELPVHEHPHVLTATERDCEHCLYFDKCQKKCSKEKCIVFEN